jgi:prepilin-type N-terminal cleavage/methylation domain-containing protein
MLFNQLLRRKPRAGRAAFTLAELLVTVAMLGVVTAVAIPTMSHTYGSTEAARNKRNAQSAVMVYTSAVAAGATFSSPPGDITGVLTELDAGKNGSGPLSNCSFRLPGLGSVETTAMLDYLEYTPAEGGLLLKLNP